MKKIVRKAAMMTLMSAFIAIIAKVLPGLIKHDHEMSLHGKVDNAHMDAEMSTSHAHI